MLNSKPIASALFVAFYLACCSSFLFGKTITTDPGNEVYTNNLGYFFVENKGQWEEDIRYKLTMGPNRLHLKKNSLFYQLLDPADLAERSHRHQHHQEYGGHGDHGAHEDVVIHGHNFIVDFIGASPNVKTSSDKKLSAYHNYILGNDPTKWAGKVGLFAEASYENLYEGIDLKFYFSDNNLKYDYIVAPGADPADILMEYNHAEKVFLKKGKLHVVTSVNEMIEQEPYAYQIIEGEKVTVPCRFQLRNNRMSFDFPHGYDRTVALVIDPVLVFASYSGSTADNWGMTATFDDDGNLYGGGRVDSDGGQYPVTPGAFDTNHPDNFDRSDMGISKFSADGRSLIYSTYIGGSDLDLPHSMIVNSKDELVIFGTTSSSNFPVSNNSFDRTFNGGQSIGLGSGLTYPNGSDIVIVVLNSEGSALTGSTFLGGSNNDGLHTTGVGARLNYSDELRGEVIVDSNDNIYIASTSNSTNFPVTVNAFDSDNNGGQDAIVAKLTPNVSNLLWATYLGGDATEAAFSIKLGANNFPYVVGMTSGSDFPVTTNGLNQTFQRVGSEAFVARLDGNGSAVLNATYLNGSDFAYFVELDDEDQVYVVGQSSTGNYPVTSGVYSNPGSTMFLHKLNSQLSQTGFSTILGNGNGTRGLFVPSAFLVDVCKRIYISGWGGTTNGSNITGMPITPDAFQDRTDGSDFYLMVLRSEARDLEYGSYFGGTVSSEHVDGGTSRFDKKGIIYQAVCAGCSSGNDDFPTTPGAVSNLNPSSNCNLGVFKFDFQFGEIVANADAAPEVSGCAPLTVNFENGTTGASIYNWNFDDGNTSTQRDPIHTFENVGTYQVRLIGSIEEDCIDPDTTFLTIETIEPPEGVKISEIICEGDLTTLTSDVTAAGVTYTWSNGATGNSIDIDAGGIYWVDATEGICPQRDSFFIEGIPNGNTTSTIGLCEGLERTISSNNSRPTATFEWDDGTRSQSIDIDQFGTYYVTAMEMGCLSIDSFIVVPDSITVDAIVLDIDCVGQDRGFIDGSTIGGEGPYEYALNSSGFSSNNVFDDLAAGAYTLESRDVNGCRDEIDLLIELPPLVEVDLGAVEQICLGDSIQLTANTNLRSNEIASVLWKGLDDPDCPDCLTQMVRPVVNSIYSLVLVSDDGCVDSTAVSVVVLPKRPVYIPSAFSPDNDGINDVFQIFARPGVVENIHVFQIYDRWGDLLFEQKNFQPNDPAFGWNGVFRNKRMNNAVFAWYAKIEFIDGVTEIFEGDVTLLK